jgi:hypothetical protein
MVTLHLRVRYFQDCTPENIPCCEENCRPSAKMGHEVVIWDVFLHIRINLFIRFLVNRSSSQRRGLSIFVRPLAP